MAHLRNEEEAIIRPRVPADDLRIVEIHHRLESGGLPLTVDEYRDRAQRAGGEHFVVEQNAGVVGHGALDHAWWTGRPDVYMLTIQMDRDRWNRGFGSRLYDVLLERATALACVRLLAWIRQDLPESEGFARRRGFKPTGQVIEESRLDVETVDLTGYGGLDERLQSQGMRVVLLSQLPHQDECFLHALHYVATQGRGTPSFDTWRREALLGPGLSPEWHWVALHGAQPIGLTYLKRYGPDAAENDYTGVAREYWGHGIARALKLRTVQWARQNGVWYLYTSSEVGNRRMLDINTRLGYRPLGRRVEMMKDLSARSNT